MAHEFTTSNFQTEVLESDKPVLVDFWAQWCGPCRQLTPVIEELAKDNPDVKVGKMNVDDAQDIARQYGVTNIPALLVFKGGEVVGSTVGAQPKSALQALLNRHK